MKIKGLISESTIVLKYKKETVNIQKSESPEVFKKVAQLIINENENSLINEFLEIKKRIENFSGDTVTIENNAIVMKGTNEAIPVAIAKKLVEMERTGEDFLPLMRFWKKLSDNPSKESRNELYDFMLANDIAISEHGDIVLEKGVEQKGGGMPGELVDGYTRMIDNSIGMEVEMPRAKVNANRNQTCSQGLHVGAPRYVRQFYSNNIIVEVIVNPKDVVSVPADYKNTKMRVCKYKVMGYASKSSRIGNKVVKLSHFFKTPPKDLKQRSIDNSTRTSEQPTVKTVVSKKMLETTTTSKWEKEIAGMSAKEIVNFVRRTTKKRITLNPKNKKAIVKKALIILETHGGKKLVSDSQVSKKATKKATKKVVKKATKKVVKQTKKIDLTNMERKELFDQLKKKFNETPNKFASTKAIKVLAKKLFTEAGHIVS